MRSAGVSVPRYAVAVHDQPASDADRAMSSFGQGDRSASAATRDDHTHAVLAALGGFAAIVANTALMLAARRGLPGDPALAAFLIGYAALFVCCSAAIEMFVAGALRRATWHVVAVVALLFLPVVFFGAWLWLPAAFAALAGWVAARRKRLALRVDPALLAWLGPVLLCVVAICLYGLAAHQHLEMQVHFFMPEYGRLGLLHKDASMFVGFAAQVMNGRWPGPALDGVQTVTYHFGVYLTFASLALATGSSPFSACMGAQQILFVPLVLFYAG